MKDQHLAAFVKACGKNAKDKNPEDWGRVSPDAVTSAEINALPNRVRRYIHDLETRCDPSGDVQTIWSQREQIAGLIKRLQELSPPTDDRVIAHATAEGSFVTSEDGFAVYWPKDSKGGAYTARILRVLADELDRRNEQWAADLERYFAKEGAKHEEANHPGAVGVDRLWSDHVGPHRHHLL